MLSLAFLIVRLHHTFIGFTDTFTFPYMAVYLYQAGSPFEEVMNAYMFTGRGINPYNPSNIPFTGSDRTVSHQLYEGAIAPNITDYNFDVVPAWAGSMNASDIPSDADVAPQGSVSTF